MREEGNVTKVEGNYAYVLVKRHSACGKCKACELGMGDRKEIEIKALNKQDAKLDDKVVLEIGSPDILKAAFIVYMIPLICFALGWLISWLLGIKDEMVNLSVGLGFMVVAFVFVKAIDKKMEATKKYEPLIVEVLEK